MKNAKFETSKEKLRLSGSSIYRSHDRKSVEENM